MKTAAIILAIVLALAGVAGLGYWYGKPAKVVENAAPAEMQADGSTIAERRPDAKAKPKQQLPKGAKVERVAEITAQGTTPAENVKPCPPVTIDTTLARMPDGSKRLLISSPDGQITRSIDFPVETPAPPPEPKVWAAGVSYDLAKQTGGLWIDRDVMRVRVGAELNQTRQFIGGPTGVEGRIKLGWTF